MLFKTCKNPSEAMSRNFFTAIGLGVVLLTSATLAQTPATATGPSLLPITTLEESLFARPRVAGAELAAQAFRELERTNWVKARSHSKALQKNSEYADYGYWIAGQVALREGEAQLSGARAKAEVALRLAEEARKNFRQVEVVNPYSPIVKNISKDLGLADVLAGRAEAKLEKWSAALKEFELGFQRLGGGANLGDLPLEVVLNFSTACQKAPSILCRPWSLRLASAFVKGSEEFKALLKAFPEVANRARSAGGETRSRAYKATDLDSAAFDAAMTLYWANEDDAAIAAFQKFLDEFPKSVFRFRVRYWLAQLLIRNKQAEHGQVILKNLQLDSPLTYYGLLASRETGVEVETSIGVMLPLGNVFDPQLLPGEQMRLKRAEELLRVGGAGLAAMELRDFKHRYVHSSPFLVYLAQLNHLAGNHVGSFTLINELLNRGYEGLPSSYVLKLIFPTPFWDLIEKYSRELALDPILVLSLVKQESSFGDAVVSSSGALGLMQLMPATAFETLPGVGRVELQKAEQNIKVGTRYLRQMLIRFKGNIVLSLAAYNAGPNAVDRWTKQIPSSRSIPETIESIPYRETREYVAAIIRNHYWYSKRMGVPVRALEYFGTATQ